MSRSRRDSSVPASGVCSAASPRPSPPSPRLFSRAAVGGGGVGCGCGFGPRVWVWPAGVGLARVGVGARLGRRPRAGRWCVFRWCPTLPLPGGGSTIGAGGLSFRVRYGSGRFPARCGRRDGGGVWCAAPGGRPPCGGVGGLVLGCVVDAGSGSPPAPARSGAGAGVRGRVGVCGSCRPISTGRLSPLPGLHLRPIDPVVHWGPSTTPGGVVRGPGLGGGFPLRCLQRLPFPDVANQRCPWRDNWRTRGSSVPVLSYWGRVSSSLLRAQRIGTELSHDVLNPARVPL